MLVRGWLIYMCVCVCRQDFSDLEKRAYLDAELCLMHDRRAATGAPGAQSRYDDLVAVHQLQASWVHLDGVGSFPLFLVFACLCYFHTCHFPGGERWRS